MSQDVAQIQQQQQAGTITEEQVSQPHALAQAVSSARALFSFAQDKNCHCTRERDVEYKGCGWNWQARQQVEQRKHMYMGQVAAMQQHYYQQLQHHQQVCLFVCMSICLPLCFFLYVYVCMHAQVCAFAVGFPHWRLCADR
jgi:hypothetical protein